MRIAHDYILADGLERRHPVQQIIVALLKTEIGNPPFVCGKLLIGELGEEYVTPMFAGWKGRVQPEADLVFYWFVKAGERRQAIQRLCGALRGIPVWRVYVVHLRCVYVGQCWENIAG